MLHRVDISTGGPVHATAGWSCPRSACAYAAQGWSYQLLCGRGPVHVVQARGSVHSTQPVIPTGGVVHAAQGRPVLRRAQ